MRKLKVLSIVREVLPYPGGYSIRGENVFHELSKYFIMHVAATNFDNSNYYSLYDFSRQPINYYINNNPHTLSKNRIANLPGSGFFLRYLRRWCFYINLKNYTKIINPDVIIANTPSDTAFPAIMLSKTLNKPCIFDIRQFNFTNMENTLRGSYEKSLTKKIIKKSNGFAVISEGTQKILKSFLVTKDTRPIAHIPNGIPRIFY